MDAPDNRTKHCDTAYQLTTAKRKRAHSRSSTDRSPSNVYDRPQYSYLRSKIRATSRQSRLRLSKISHNSFFACNGFWRIRVLAGTYPVLLSAMKSKRELDLVYEQAQDSYPHPYMEVKIYGTCSFLCRDYKNRDFIGSGRPIEILHIGDDGPRRSKLSARDDFLLPLHADAHPLSQFPNRKTI